MFVGVSPFRPFIADGGHFLPEGVIPGQFHDFIGQGLVVQRRNYGSCRAQMIGAVSINQFPAAAHVSRHIGTVGREAFQDTEGLAFGNTGKHEDIHLWQVFRHIDGSREMTMAKAQGLHSAPAHGGVFGVFFHISHDIKFGVRHFLLYPEKGADKGDDILDGYDPDYSADDDGPFMVRKTREYL